MVYLSLGLEDGSLVGGMQDVRKGWSTSEKNES